MRNTIVAACAALMTAAAGLAAAAAETPQAQAWAVVQHYDTAFNKGDAKTIVSLCTPDAVIIDDFAPHAWQGANTCGAWLAALAAFDKKTGVTDGIVTLHKPWRVAVTGARAYVVVPVTYTYKQNGKPVVEAGSVWTLVLQSTRAGWRVAGWSWAQHG
jgi:ketosteroid isomerase-like protein